MTFIGITTPSLETFSLLLIFLIMVEQSGYQQAHCTLMEQTTSLATQQMVPVLVVVMQLIQKRTPHLVSVVLVILVISVGCSRLYIYIYINSPSIE